MANPYGLDFTTPASSLLVEPQPPAPVSPLLEKQALPPLPELPTYGETDFSNPKRAAWAGLLGDMSQFFLSGARTPVGGGAMQAYQAAQQRNDKMRAANAQAAQQGYTNQLGQLTTSSALQTQGLQRENIAGQMGDLEAQREMGAIPGADADFNQFMMAGGEAGTGKSFDEWQLSKARALALASTTTPADVLTTQWLMEQPEEVRRLHMGAHKSAQVQEVNGVPLVLDPVTNNYRIPGLGGREFTSVEEAREFVTRGAAEEAREKAFSTDLGVQEAALDQTIGALPKMERTLADLKSTQAMFTGDKPPPTGFLAGRFKQYTSPEAALIEFKGAIAALERLSEVSLGAISSEELNLLKGLYADLKSSPEVNAAKMGELVGSLENTIGDVKARARYMAANNGSLRGFALSQFSESEARNKPKETPKTGDEDILNKIGSM